MEYFSLELAIPIMVVNYGKVMEHTTALKCWTLTLALSTPILGV
jgi:hypothetical protein